MKIKSVKKVLLWSYERGSWQYDVLCALILAFIFFTPSEWFHEPPPSPPPVAGTNEPGRNHRPSGDKSQKTEKEAGDSPKETPPTPR